MPPAFSDAPATVDDETRRLVADLAAEALDLVAWILTAEPGYEPPSDPVPTMLRTAACRLQYPYPGRGPALCVQVTEAAARAVAFVAALRYRPADTGEDVTAGQISLLTQDRAVLPDLMRAAARVCHDARAL